MRIVGVEPIAKATFPELEVDKAIEWIKRFPRHSAPSFNGRLTYAAYKYIPASYILCENDFLIPPDTQREYIHRIETESGKAVDVHTLNTGHCPNVTAPDELAKVVANIAASA